MTAHTAEPGRERHLVPRLGAASSPPHLVKGHLNFPVIDPSIIRPAQRSPQRLKLHRINQPPRSAGGMPACMTHSAHSFTYRLRRPRWWGKLLPVGAQRTYNPLVGTKDERINLRVDAGQKKLLEAASEAERTSVSAFVLAAATAAASDVLADRRAFSLDEHAWAAFDVALTRPAREVPGLRQLMAEPTVLDPGE